MRIAIPTGYILIASDIKAAQELYSLRLISWEFALLRLKAGYLARKGLMS